jgi:hypothetical protein
MRETDGEALDWTVRSAVYAHIVATGRPPTAEEMATALAVSTDEALAAFRRLDERHALFLEPGADTIRMAHPFSGVPTAFHVRANEQDYWANCAWDSLGIAAALHADAEITATYAEDGAPLALTVKNGEAHGPEAVVHLQVPFRRWYDDLVHT